MPLLSDYTGDQIAFLLGHKRNSIKCQPINGAPGNIKTGPGLVWDEMGLNLENGNE